MTSLGIELVGAVRHELGAPFQHHYKPTNECLGGTITVGSCMEKGLGNYGYDCTGLIIIGLCRVLGLSPSNWPGQYRHSAQLNQFGVDRNPEFGDIILIDSDNGSGYRYNTHIGVHIEKNKMVHASGKSKLVEEGVPMGITIGIKVVDMNALLNAIPTTLKP